MAQKPPPPPARPAAAAAASQLRELGEKLEAAAPASKDALVKLLKQAADCLSDIEQSPLPSVLDSLQPCLKALAKQELLKHQDRDVKVLVATCICESTRITAPEAPYGDDVLRDIFHLIVGTFSGLSDVNSPSFSRRVVILETVARYRSCVVMLDLECNDLINEMFHSFLKVASDNHALSVLNSMQTIMVLIIDESEDIHESLLGILLSALGRKRTDFSMAARRLAMNVIEHCAGKLEPCIKQFLISSLAGDDSCLIDSIDHHDVIFDIYQCAPKILKGVVPYITGELLTDKLDIRSKAVELLGELFALPGVPILESFTPLFSEFLKRLTDRVVEVRVSVIEHLKNCLMSSPSRPEAPQIINALCDRLLDYEENVRKQVVAALCDVACHSLEAIPAETTRLVAERIRDKSLSVKSYTMERLSDLYKLYCRKSSDSSRTADDFEWIPGKILKCLYDKDFRPESIELILCGSLFPPEFSTKDRVKHWVMAFSGFDKAEVKALELILLQKQRLQQEMQKYMSLRKTSQEDAPDLPKRISGCFRSMSRLFSDHIKAEDNLNMLNQLKDVNIWKILTSLLDPVTTFHEAWSLRADLLKILGEKHPLYDFMSALSIRCSYLLINKEYIKEILSEAIEQKSTGNTKLMSSCMNLLTVIASFFPLLLSGIEEDLVHLLKEDNEILKEGIAHVLSKAGGIIREQLATASSSIDLLLERLCLEGSRKQAKYSVHALAAITKDDGLMSLSVLYKRLVDMLEEKVHLPSILQSLGCIAQIAMPIFETREEEIVGFIQSKILECNNNVDEDSTDKSEWSESTESCLLKIYGIKTLVKSYLPSKDAHARPGIEKLMGVLKNILSYGDISPSMTSSAVHKAHMRLAAAKAVLRLSRQWDQKVPVDVFYLTLRISQDVYPQLRKLFLSKVHQYIKERILDAKYACAFLLSMNDYRSPEYEECKHNLLEVVQICQQVKMRQLSVQADMNLLVAYPEYIISYLVHALAHDPSCPTIEECKDVEAFGPIYWRLHLLLSVLLIGDEGLQHGVPSTKKEYFTTIISIFSSIKSAQDVIDGKKTKTLHAICDLGLSIAKRLVHDQVDTSETKMVPLPTLFYTHLEDSEKENSVGNDEQGWLGCESVLVHFEALKTESKDMVDSGAAKEEMVLDEFDGDGNEVPLGKMLKILKSQGAKKKKIMKKQKIHSGLTSTGNDDDVLGLVREINLDNIESLGEMQTSKPEKDQMDLKDGNEKTSSSQKQIERDSGMVGVSTPKRKRSVCKQRPLSAKSNKASSGILMHSVKMEEASKSLENKLAMEKGMVESTESGFLVSCLPTNRTSLSKAKKGVNKSPTEEVISNNSKKSAIAEDSDKKADESRSLNGSVKKRKRRSISGLAKCSTHSGESSDADLVGSRVKVWWPLDKQYYEGVVQSYDSAKRKHAIYYDDGDVEVLNLAKEKWQLIGSNDSPVKTDQKWRKYDHQHKELSHEKKTYSSKHLDSGKPKKSPKKSSPSKRKGKPKGRRSDQIIRRPSDGKKSAEVSSSDGGNDSDSSNAHSHSESDADDVNSDGHEGKEMEHCSEEEEKTQEGLHEDVEVVKEHRPDHRSSNGKEESDDEPLSSWRQRTTKVM